MEEHVELAADDCERASRLQSGASRAKRWPNRMILLAFVGLVGTLAAYGYWVGWADSDDYETADAVFVHAGQRHRLRLAQDLMDQGVAPVLVLMFAAEAYTEHEELCQPTDDYLVLCPSSSDRVDTVGEARELDRLAREHGWESVVVVTSTFHLRRARYLDRKCASVTIHGVGARAKDLPTHLRAVLREMPAMPFALLASCKEQRAG